LCIEDGRLTLKFVSMHEGSRTPPQSADMLGRRQLSGIVRPRNASAQDARAKSSVPPDDKRRAWACDFVDRAGDQLDALDYRESRYRERMIWVDDDYIREIGFNGRSGRLD